MSDLISVESLLVPWLSDAIQIIDVRAPIEFAGGAIPDSVNLPILDDEERAKVGTAYKRLGKDRAIELGHRLVQGELRTTRIMNWIRQCQSSSKQPVVTCFRGGLRSKTTQDWMKASGLPVPRIEGGYKKFRNHLIAQIEDFSTHFKLLVLTGKTGSGKTQLLRSLDRYPFLDLEKLAQHRGSAFGKFLTNQPSQVDFENLLARDLMRLRQIAKSVPVLVEDECRLIGRSVQPLPFFNLLRSSPVIVLEEPLETRVENTWQEYIVDCLHEKDLFPRLRESTNRLQKKLGGQRLGEILRDIEIAESAWTEHRDFSLSKIWIEKLLLWYYDPAYEQSLAIRNPSLLVRGNRKTIADFLATFFNSAGV